MVKVSNFGRVTTHHAPLPKRVTDRTMGAVRGDAQSPVTARLRDITSRHGIRHKCDI